MTAPYPIEEMRKFIVENFPHNDDMCHPEHRAGALMSAILRWWDDEEKPSLDAAEALIRKNADRMNEMQKEIERLQTREEKFGEMAVHISSHLKAFVLGSSKRTQLALDAAEFWVDQYEAQAKHISELESQINSWIADRDSWISRYQDLQKENLENRKALSGCGAAIVKQRAALKKLGRWYCILRDMLRDPDIDYKLSQNPNYVQEQLRQEKLL